MENDNQAAVEETVVQNLDGGADNTESAKVVEPEKTVPLAALMAERAKRQEKDRELQNQARELELLRSRTQPASTVTNDEDQPPKFEDYAGREAQFYADAGAYGARQENKKFQVEQQRQQQQRVIQTDSEKAIGRVTSAVAELSVLNPTFEAKFQAALSQGLAFPATHEVLVGESKDPKKVLEYLVENPTEALRIQSLPPLKAALEIGEISTRVSQQQKQKQPPEPLEMVRGGGGGSNDSSIAGATARMFPI